MIAVSGLAFHGIEGCKALAQPFQLFCDRLLGHLGGRPAHLEALVLAELRGWPNTDLDRELQRSAAGLGHRGDVELGIADRRDPRLDHGALVPLRQGVAQRLLDDGAAADPLQHDLSRNLALAKAGDLEFTAKLGSRPLDANIDLGSFDLDLDAGS